MSNKQQFDAYMREIAPEFIPKTFFYIKNGKVISENITGSDFITAVNTLEDGTYFLKKADEDQGKSVFLIKKYGTNITINRGSVPIERFLSETVNTDKSFILQEKIEQHPDIAAFNPSSVNTVRIVTTHFNDKAHVLAATLKTGCKDTWLDNASQGGTFVRIYDEKETLVNLEKKDILYLILSTIDIKYLIGNSW